MCLMWCEVNDFHFLPQRISFDPNSALFVHGHCKWRFTAQFIPLIGMFRPQLTSDMWSAKLLKRKKKTTKMLWCALAPIWDESTCVGCCVGYFAGALREWGSMLPQRGLYRFGPYLCYHGVGSFSSLLPPSLPVYQRKVHRQNAYCRKFVQKSDNERETTWMKLTELIIGLRVHSSIAFFYKWHEKMWCISSANSSPLF